MCSFLFSYDISCAYCVNALMRFLSSFPDISDIVRQFEYCVPLVHVHNHKDNCTYLYASTYKTHAGHFHGETAEQVWPYANPFGPQCRQMNPGLRQETYIAIYNHWNLKKSVNLGEQC